jgi:hypothetical protein
MGSHIVRITLFALCLGCSATGAQAQVCAKIDESHDTLAPGDRTAALLLIDRQFAQAGEPVAAGCPNPYLLAHIKLGNFITVLLTGPKGHREGTALGLEDLPALYSQMVRSLVTGQPMTSLAIIDRGNVTSAQASSQRVASDSFTYARLGYGAAFGDVAYMMPSIGFGYRAELDKVAIDFSFLNLQTNDTGYWSDETDAGTTSLIKLSGLYFFREWANATPYAGGGLSWGRTDLDRAVTVEGPPLRNGTPITYVSTMPGSGSGLQAELTGGYEFGRATSIRLFVQSDLTMPLYSVRTTALGPFGEVTAASRRWMPTLVTSIGLGWARRGK